MRKKSKVKKMVWAILIVLIVILSLILIIREKDENKAIIATKTFSNTNELGEKTKYKIKIKNYDIESVQKEITFDTEEQAQCEYQRYEIINEFERKNLNVQIKKKKLTIQMTEEQFKEDIEYDEQKNITYINSEGEQKEIMNQEEIINALAKKGYTIK